MRNKAEALISRLKWPSTGATRLLAGFFIYLIVEGALRKWVWPAGGVLLFAVKDVILFFALASLLASKDGLEKQMTSQMVHSVHFPIWLAWLFMTLLFLVISPLDLSSFAGLRYYLAPLPLILLVPAVLSRPGQLPRWLRAASLITIAICILGIVQFFSPIDHPINKYAWIYDESASVATFGDPNEVGFGRGIARITGTFSFISTYAAFLQAMLFVSIADFVVSSDRRKTVRAAACFGLVFANMAMTGARSAVLITAVTLLPFLPFLYSTIARGRSRLIQVLVAVTIFGVIGGFLAQAFEALSQRASIESDNESRLRGAMFLPFFTLSESPAIGRGVGTTFLALAEVTQGSSNRDMNFDEISTDRLGTELGWAAYLFVLFVKLAYVGIAARIYVKSRDPAIKVLAMLSFAWQLCSHWEIPIYNAVAASFYFAGIGLAIWLHRITATNPRRVGASESAPAVNRGGAPKALGHGADQRFALRPPR
jgi:hypothetical protein